MNFLRQAFLATIAFLAYIETSSGQCLYPPCPTDPPPTTRPPTTLAPKTSPAATTAEVNTTSEMPATTTTAVLSTSSKTPTASSTQTQSEETTTTTLASTTKAPVDPRGVGTGGIVGMVLLCLLVVGLIVLVIKWKWMSVVIWCGGLRIRWRGYRILMCRRESEDIIYEINTVELAARGVAAAARSYGPAVVETVNEYWVHQD